jgi:hypothetical protein
MDLVAEMLLHNEWEYLVPEIEGCSYMPETRALFSNRMTNQLAPAHKALLDEDAKNWEFASNAGILAEVLQRAGINIKDIADPWGTPYRFAFNIAWRYRTIGISSAGPDKQFDTADDISVDQLNWEYFKPYGKIIDRVVKETYASSGSYIKDFNTLNTALVRRGVDLNSLRDPWGNSYQLNFSVNGSAYQINVQSRSSEGQHMLYEVWTSRIDYFARTRELIDNALYEYFKSKAIFPRDDQSLDRALDGSDVQFRRLVDPWGHTYYVNYGYESDYGNTEKISYNPDARVQNTVAVTRKLATIRILSSGADGKPGTPDDFVLATFFRDISEQSGKDLAPKPTSTEPLSGYNGAIKGTITDATAAVLPGATILAKQRQTGLEFSATSKPDGSYIVRNIPPGVYDVSFSLAGFMTAMIRDVPVHSTSITTVNVVLQIASISTMVEVNMSPENLLLESSASVGTVMRKSGAIAQVHEETFTPRLRDYFPETLLWAPSIVTDSSGHARLKFKLADNITTWKMTVLASTKTGEIGVAEKEIEAFQPFFLDHDPPKILTIGDAIDLPVIVRNYLPQAQKLNIEMKPASWLELQNPGKQQIAVAAGESRPVVFPFKAIAMVKSGKQQVLAANRATGDAIEKAVRVHPDGLEQDSSVSALLSSEETLLLQIPGDAIPGSTNARLKIYPNLIAHVTESIEAGLERPYGCGEQTISSTYPSVMLLKYYKASGKSDALFKNKAERYLKLGYQRLLNYRKPEGGFSYWGHGDADVALTAYALRFLYDASEFIEIKSEVISDAEKWLIHQQDKDGSWHSAYGYNYDCLTGYAAVTLAQAEKHGKGKSATALHEALVRVLAYMSDLHRNIDEPYALAELALAAAESGDRQKAAAVLEKLSGLANQERKGFYWALNGNTPFYGWGRAGRIESTAMAVLALSTAGSNSAQIRRLIDGGTLWLLQQKDRYGVWYSGQATITVLSAILSRLAAYGPVSPDAQVTVFVNDRPVELNRSTLKSDAPAILNVSDLVKPGENSVRVKSAGMFPAASIQAVADYYIPWTGPSVREITRPGNSEGLRLAVRFDKTGAVIGDRINCTVEAERIGSRGWGMMIAEVGLPPGADVDRSSLDEAMHNSGWAVSRYDVLPDRLQLYLWPRAGGVKLTFSFKPRYGLKARTAPSTLYDYYNPEAQVSLPPADFIIRNAAQAKDVAAKAGMPISQ